MQFLVVEDDENKQRSILDFLARHYGAASVECSASLVTGLRELKQGAFDIVILDMTLPNYDSSGPDPDGRMHAFGGKEFLRQMVRMSNGGKVIVLTQFESFGEAPNVTGLTDLDADLRLKFPKHYVGAVYYHASINEWEERLKTLIESVELP